MRVTLALLAGIVALACGAGPAHASRRATVAESSAMWRVVDKAGKCVHHRGTISTIKSSKYRYGTVVVSDRNCGNGQPVLRRARAGGRWRVLRQGSDWGDPARCADDLKVIPLRVMRDLLYEEICST